MVTVLSLMVATLASEDLACLTAGLLVQRGQVSAVVAVLACAVGIVAGDLGLWLIGRLAGEQLPRWWPAASRRVDAVRRSRWGRMLERRAGAAMLASRFLPGTRLPLYLLAGVVRVPAITFAGWAAIGALLWTPVLVLSSARFGDAVAAHVEPVLGATGTVVTVALVVVCGLRRVRVMAGRASWGLTPPSVCPDPVVRGA